MKLPRIMLAAPASGSGKTMVTLGILQALLNRGKNPASFKCGPDYIDPMFHGRVLGVPSKNLDTYFTEDSVTRMLFGKEASKADISVMEGVMGFYDGIAGTETKASSYDLARVTETPVVLVVNTKGMSLSAAAVVKGFMELKKDSNIKGVILNRMSAMLYPRIKEQLEELLPVKVLGYVPEMPKFRIGSRHLGLVTPDEIQGLRDMIRELTGLLEETIDFDMLCRLAEDAPDLLWEDMVLPHPKRKVRIGVARDEAFCFFYRDNLELLEQMGAQLCFFSPLRDEHLPKGIQGLIFYGGYPELYAEKINQNLTMLEDVKFALEGGMPCLAECGGFMYLHRTMEDLDGKVWPMGGVLEGDSFHTGKLTRFGYVELTAGRDSLLGPAGLVIRGHEFHYYDSTDNGGDFYAKKPGSSRGWDCMHADNRKALGFPHLYYYSNPRMICNFLETCAGGLQGEENG